MDKHERYIKILELIDKGKSHRVIQKNLKIMNQDIVFARNNRELILTGKAKPKNQQEAILRELLANTRGVHKDKKRKQLRILNRIEKTTLILARNDLEIITYRRERAIQRFQYYERYKKGYLKPYAFNNPYTVLDQRDDMLNVMYTFPPVIKKLVQEINIANYFFNKFTKELKQIKLYEKPLGKNNAMWGVQ